MSRREQEHLIQTVYPGSIAEELEIEPGDVLLKINGQKIEDVFDYRYLMFDYNRIFTGNCIFSHHVEK